MSRKPKDPTPQDVIRLVCLMTREQRARFKYFCSSTGADMERLGTDWIMERLAAEERKLPRPK